MVGNWITRIITQAEKIKTAIKKRASKEDIANSDWTSCCTGPILTMALIGPHAPLYPGNFESNTALCFINRSWNADFVSSFIRLSGSRLTDSLGVTS